MSKSIFSKSSKSLSVFVSILFFSGGLSCFVLAEEDTGSGNVILENVTQTGSEVMEIFLTATGSEVANTGSVIIETNSNVDNFDEQKRLERMRLHFKTKNLSAEKQENLWEKAEKVKEKIDSNQSLKQQIQDFKAQKENSQMREKQNKNALQEINLALKTEFEEIVEANFTEEEQAQVTLEPNYLFELQSESLLDKGDLEDFAINDPQYPNQWALKSIVASPLEKGVGGSATAYTPLIALIDTGVNYNHEDLQGQFWTAENCVNDLNEPIVGGCLKGGYDFVDNDDDPYATDNYAHGTQVAGILVAKTNNNLGIASLANLFTLELQSEIPLEGAGGVKPQVMALRVADQGILELDKVIQAIYFAVNNGADILNLSFGGPTYSENLKTALEYAQSQGVIIVAAAGNYGTNNDTTPIYPASYALNNIISVTALDQNEELASFANYGPNSVDIGAPGVDILTTSFTSPLLGETERGTYVKVSGTSFATPFVVSAYVYYVNVVREFILGYDLFD